MTEMAKDYEDVTQYPLDPEREEELIELQRECCFMWANKAGHPIGVIMSYLEHNGKLWLTATNTRARVPAIKRSGLSSICITSTGTEMGGGKTVTYKGHTVIHEGDQDINNWFYPALAARLYPEGEASEAKRVQFAEFLDSPHRVVFEFKSEKKILYDGDKMWAATPDADAPGDWEPEG